MTEGPFIKKGSLLMPNPDYVPPPPPEAATDDEVAVAIALERQFGGVLLPVQPYRDNWHVERAIRFLSEMRSQGLKVVKESEA